MVNGLDGDIISLFQLIPLDKLILIILLLIRLLILKWIPKLIQLLG